MRIIKQEFKVYEFSELSEDAQQNVIQRWLSSAEYPWCDENEDALDWFTNVFDVDVSNYQYGFRAPSIDYSLNWSWDDLENLQSLSGQRLATYLWNNYRDQLYSGKYYSTAGHYDENNKYHYRCRRSRIILEIACPTGYCVSQNIISPLHEFMRHPRDITFEDLLYECLQEWVNVCSSDYESYYSKDNARESIEANGYEFHENGDIC